MDWKYVPMMHSLSEHRECYERRSRMKEMWSENIHHGFGRKKYRYSCGPLALQSPGGSSVAMFKNIPIHMWLPNSTTDPQHGLKHMFKWCMPFLNTENVAKRAVECKRFCQKNTSWFWSGKSMDIVVAPLALQSPGGSSVAMFKNTPIHDFSIVLQIPNMDWTYVQTMRSLSVHPKSYTGRSLMREMRSMVGRSMDIYRCGFLLLGFAIPWGQLSSHV